MTVSQSCVILVKWQDRPFSKCLVCKSNQLFCMVQKYGAFSMLMWLRKSTPLLVNVFLNVPLKTPNKCEYGDLGRYPLFVNSCTWAVKYWFKLLHMNENRLPKQTYHMQINMEWNGKCCWASGLRDLLCKFGFVCLQKSVGNERAFVAILKERLCDDFNQEWTTAINSSERFYLYASFKSNLLTENYLDFVQIKCFRDVLIKLRMGVPPLNANRLRYAHKNASKILCSFCETEVEDEVHFICFCPLYKELHQKYIHWYLQTEHSFTLLMQYHKKSSSQNLAFFVFHACKKRDIYILLK